MPCIKILPGVFKRFKHNELDKVLRLVNLPEPARIVPARMTLSGWQAGSSGGCDQVSYAIPETDITHIIIYAFKDIKEYDSYFRKNLKEFGDYVEIKHTFVFFHPET